MRKRLFPLLALVSIALGITAAPPNAAAQLAATPMLLVAQPQIADPLFKESVVLVTRHGRSRPIGIILNHPTDAVPPADPSQSGGPSARQFSGGPVSPQSVVFLFKADGPVASNLLSLGESVYLGFGQDPLDELSSRQPPPLRLRAFNGFAAWGRGQLENEIARGDWLPLPFDADAVFRTDTANMWRELAAKARGRSI